MFLQVVLYTYDMSNYIICIILMNKYIIHTLYFVPTKNLRTCSAVHLRSAIINDETSHQFY